MTAHRTNRPLAGRRIAILMESDYVDDEISYYQKRFAEEGVEVALLTRLWGNDAITFESHERRLPITVSGDLEQLDYAELATYSALIVPAGMVSDRLRYTEDVTRLAPAVELLRRAFRMPTLIKGFICHALWLAAPVPEVVAGRPLTCHNNLIGDVRNMGARYLDEDVVVDGDLVTARTAGHCHLFARTLIDLLTAAASETNGATAAEPKSNGQPDQQAAVRLVREVAGGR
jgi:protease I